MIDTLDRPIPHDSAFAGIAPAQPIPSSPIREKPVRDVLAIAERRGRLASDPNAGSIAGRVLPVPSTRVASSAESGALKSAIQSTSSIDAARATAATGVSVIIPCWNEEGSIESTARQLREALRGSGRPFELVFVDDGSTDATAEKLAALERDKNVRVIRHARNRGYGFSLKDGIEHAAYDLLAIVDADGTYPITRLVELIDRADGADMVVGARIGPSVQIPAMRRPAKWALRKLACHLAACEIPDLNSGMRVMRRDVVRRFRGLLPDGFSFTTTITLAMLTHGYDVQYVPIDYARRVGRSSIRPARDTLGFLALIIRTILCFRPLRVFVPASAALFFTAVVVAVVSKIALGKVADVTSVTLAMSAIQMMGIGLVADLIDRRVPYAGA